MKIHYTDHMGPVKTHLPQKRFHCTAPLGFNLTTESLTITQFTQCPDCNLILRIYFLNT